MSRHGSGVVLAVVFGALGLAAGASAAEVKLPTPVAVPADLAPQVRESLEQDRKALEATRAALATDIGAHNQKCRAVPSDAAARIAACQASGQQLQARYSAFAADADHFRRLVALATAVRRHHVALDGFESGLKAFAYEVSAAGLTALFNEINTALPFFVVSLRDPSKIVPTAVVLLETGKLLSWWNAFYLDYTRGCTFSSEDLKTTCRNLVPLSKTVERTREALQQAEAAVKPRPVTTK